MPNPPRSTPPASELRIGAHGLAGLLGLGNLAIGILSLFGNAPGALMAFLLVAGVVTPTLAWFSYRRSRAAWSFLVAMCGVFAVIYTFGAPKIAHTLSLGLGTALIAPALYAAAFVALACLRDDYGTDPTAA
jgi:hypothetical protein